MRPLSRLAALSVLLLNACYPAGDGKPPPPEELYFPTGVAIDGHTKSDIDRGPKYLYVVNSDFDLQYRSASLISYDLGLLNENIPKSCNQDGDCPAATPTCDVPGVRAETDVPTYYCIATGQPPCPSGERDEADRVLYPGRCNPIDPGATDGLTVDTVGIGAFATDVIWRKNPENPEYSSRLFIPVRGDSTLHWIDVRNDDAVATGRDQLECGQGGDDSLCDSLHRSGDTAEDNPDRLRLPPEPYALDATSDGKYIGITNQTSGKVSLFFNDWASVDGPKLVSILGGLPLAPVGIAALPDHLYADGTPVFAENQRPAPGFLVAYRSAAQIDLLRVLDQQPDTGTPLSNYSRFALRRAGSVTINANSLGFDSRGIAIDGAQRQQDYDHCRETIGDCSTAADPAQCQSSLTNCARAVHQPGVYVASRAPASLLVGEMTADAAYPTGTSDLPSFTDSIPLTFGPSRAIVGDIRVRGTASSKLSDRAGPYELERRVFIVCFDSRRIFVYDPKRNTIDAIVSTGRGPYALAVDGERGLAYLGHFTDSYLGVISLDQRFPQTYATIIASIGTPKAPRSSK